MLTPIQTHLLKLFVIGCVAISVAACSTAPGSSLPSTSGYDVTTSGHPSSVGPSAALPHSESRLPVLPIWLDCSSSVDADVLAKNVDDLLHALDRHKHRLSGVEVICFANGDRSVWSETPDRFIWGDFPAPPSFQPNFDHAPPNVKVFQDAKDRWLNEQKAIYGRQNSEALAQYENRTKQAFGALRTRLLHRPTVAASCTRFFDLGYRLQWEQRPRNLILTDGANDCVKETIATVPLLEISGTVVILQIPSNRDSSAHSDELKEREAFLKALFPSASIQPVFMTQQAIDELLK